MHVAVQLSTDAGPNEGPRYIGLRRHAQEVSAVENRLSNLVALCERYKVAIPRSTRSGFDRLLRANFTQMLPVLAQAEAELGGHRTTLTSLRRTLLTASEDKAVLTLARTFHDESGGDRALMARLATSSEAGLRRRRGTGAAAREIEMAPVTPVGSGFESDLDPELGALSRLNAVACGVVDAVQTPLLERVVQRLSRGTTFARFIDIPEPFYDAEAGRFVRKAFFYLVLLGRGLETKVARLCSSLGGRLVPLPDSSQGYDDLLEAAETAAADTRTAIQATERMIVQILTDLAGANADGPGAAALPGATPSSAAAGASSSSSSSLAGLSLSGGANAGGAGANGASPLRMLEAAVTRERHVVEALSRAAFTERYVIFEGWIPRFARRELVQRMRRIQRHDSSLSAPAVVFIPGAVARAAQRGPPPTLIRTDSFSGLFQSIVDTYGVPRYREVNPGLFTIVTFPFLFAVMFGDIGHGAALLVVGLYFVLTRATWERRIRLHRAGELAAGLFAARWMLLLMGIFSLYMGLIYNDLFSLPVSLFGSANYVKPVVPVGMRAGNHKLWNGQVYPFGMDPGWGHAKNELQYRNSFKMKMAVVLGVLHMTLGIILSVFNHVHFGDTISLVTEFIPRLLFLTCTFGYMIFMIFYKWCVNWFAISKQPPNLIQSMISMFLKLGDPGADPLYAGQLSAQRVLLFISVATLPVMFLAKPLLLYRKQQARHARYQRLNDDHGGGDGGRSSSGGPIASDGMPQGLDGAASPAVSVGNDVVGSGNGSGGSNGESGSDHHSLSDLMIHQAIHTIEFVLGAVSNTASYLRLWALSLAHAQLSSVFWDKILMEYGINKGPFFAFIAWAGWAGATGGVLLGMDALECFLHALRLHWVEFQNKFYYADGRAWAPMSLAASAVSLGDMAREAQAEQRKRSVTVAAAAAAAAAGGETAAAAGLGAGGVSSDAGYYGELDGFDGSVAGAGDDDDDFSDDDGDDDDDGGGHGGGRRRGGAGDGDLSDGLGLGDEETLFAAPLGGDAYDSSGRRVRAGGLLDGSADDGSDTDEDDGYFREVDDEGAAAAEARNRLMSRVQFDQASP